MNRIGERIRELRKKNELTQERLADVLGVTSKAISKWETGAGCPDISLIVPLARVLGVTTDELLGMKDAERSSEREKYNVGLQKYRDCEAVQLNYAWARAAVIDFPDDDSYLEWLAFAEYRLAFEECRREDGSGEFIQEMTDNALRRLETIIESSPDRELVRKAIMDKIMVLRFLDRVEEAEWSAEFEYPDPNFKTVSQVLQLSPAGRELQRLLDGEKMATE